MQAPPGQIKRIKPLNELCEAEHDHPLSAHMICAVLDVQALASLATLTLSTNDQRDDKLARFVHTINQPRIEWIQAVKATEWDKFSWSGEAARLFLDSESLGISGTVAFAVVAASMALQGFKVPNDLNKRLFGAKTTSQRRVKELADAEERRAAELATPKQTTPPSDHAKT